MKKGTVRDGVILMNEKAPYVIIYYYDYTKLYYRTFLFSSALTYTLVLVLKKEDPMS